VHRASLLIILIDTFCHYQLNEESHVSGLRGVHKHVLVCVSLLKIKYNIIYIKGCTKIDSAVKLKKRFVKNRVEKEKTAIVFYIVIK